MEVQIYKIILLYIYIYIIYYELLDILNLNTYSKIIFSVLLSYTHNVAFLSIINLINY